MNEVRKDEEADPANQESPPRRSKILLQVIDEDLPHPREEETKGPAVEQSGVSNVLQRLPPRVELSPAIASMLAAMEKEKKPTLYWDKIKVVLVKFRHVISWYSCHSIYRSNMRLYGKV